MLQSICQKVRSLYFLNKEQEIYETSNLLKQMNSHISNILYKAKDEHLSVCKREKALSVISNNSLKFLEAQIDSRVSLSTFIKDLGKSIDVNRIFLLKRNDNNDTFSILDDCVFEWINNDNVSLFGSLDQFKNIHIKNKKYLSSVVSNFLYDDIALKLYFDKNIQQYCSVPIMVKNSVAGIMIINSCSNLNKWDSNDLKVLQTAANLIGAWWNRLILDFKIFHCRDNLKAINDLSYKNVFEFLSFPAIICSTDNIIFDCNKSAAEFFKLNKSQVIGKSCSEFISNMNCIKDSKQKAYSGKGNSHNFFTKTRLKGNTTIYEAVLSIIPNTKNFICLLCNTDRSISKLN